MSSESSTTSTVESGSNHRLIVAGSRSFGSASRSRAKALVVSLIRSLPREVGEVVSGTARGADSVGEDAAEYLGIPVGRFPADWDRHGKRAGPIRNEEMAEYADGLLAIWDGESSGTHNMIRTAVDEGLNVVVWNYKEERVVPTEEIQGVEMDDDESDPDPDDESDADDASDGGSVNQNPELGVGTTHHADGRNTELADVLPSLDERDAWRLAQMGIDTVADVVSHSPDELANKPLFEGDAEAVRADALALVDDDDDDEVDEISVAEANEMSTSDQKRETERQLTNETERRCTPETTVAVVAPDGHFEGMNNSQTRSKIQNAIDRSPFDPTGIVAVSDFEGTEIDASIHLHNVYAEDEDDEYNRYKAVQTPWDDVEGRDDAEIGTKTDADGNVVHRWFKGAPSERDSEVIRVCDAIIALKVTGYVEDLVEKAIDSGIPHYDDLKRSATYPDRQVTIQAFDDAQLRDGHQGALDEDDARENPRSEVENTW